MRWFKKIGPGILIVFIAIQFIQPVQNTNGQVGKTDICNVVFVPQKVHLLLQTACYDCHSNTTDYSWYNDVQPVAWILANHIKNGKKDLNFSDFGSYSVRMQESKLKGIRSQIRDDEMPLYSYKIMHKDSRLSKEEKALIINWAENAADSLDKIHL